MKNYFLLTFFLLSQINYSFAQSTESRVRSLEKHVKENSVNNMIKFDSIESRIERTNNLIDDLTKKTNVLSLQIERLEGRENDRKEKLDMLFNMIGQSGSSIENQLNAASITLTVLLVFIGLFIAWREKSMSKILEKSDVNLQKTQEIRNLIENEMSTLYQRLKEEELNDIIQKIERDANEVQNHISRLHALDLKKIHFTKLVNVLIKCSTDPNQNENINYLLVVLINKFPNDMADNSHFSPIIASHWSSMYRSLNIDKVETFVDCYISAFMLNKFPSIERHVSIILEETSKSYSAQYMARKVLFETYPNKDDRFKILKMLLDNKISAILLGYGSDGFQHLMRNEYSKREDNTQEQNNLLDSNIITK